MSEKKIQNVELGEIKTETGEKKVLHDMKLDLVKGVKLQIKALLGNTEITVGELFDLKENSVLKLDAKTNQPIELQLDGKLVARGSLVVVDDNFGIQITEVVKA